MLPPGAAAPLSNPGWLLMSTPPQCIHRSSTLPPIFFEDPMKACENYLARGWEIPLYLKFPSVLNCYTGSHWVFVNLLNFSWFLFTCFYEDCPPSTSLPSLLSVKWNCVFYFSKGLAIFWNTVYLVSLWLQLCKGHPQLRFSKLLSYFSLLEL